MYDAFFYFDGTAAQVRTPGFSPVTAVAVSALLDKDATGSGSSITSVAGTMTALSLVLSALLSLVSTPVASYPGARDSSTGAYPWFPEPVVVCFVSVFFWYAS